MNYADKNLWGLLSNMILSLLLAVKQFAVNSLMSFNDLQCLNKHSLKVFFS